MWPFKPNDWKVIHIETQEFHISYEDHLDVKRNTNQICKLLYSQSRNRYKIKFEGYTPHDGNKSTDAYINCLKKKFELENIHV